MKWLSCYLHSSHSPACQIKDHPYSPHSRHLGEDKRLPHKCRRGFTCAIIALCHITKGQTSALSVFSISMKRGYHLRCYGRNRFVFNRFNSWFTDLFTWWRHQMETFSALLATCAGNSPVPGEYPSQRPVTQSFGVFFDLRLNKRLSKQSLGWWFETI